MSKYKHEVLSYDENRIQSYVDINGNFIYSKRTTLIEFQNLRMANEYLREFPIYLIKDIRLLTVNPVSYNPETGILETQFFEGENLELLLRNNSVNRQFILSLIKDFFLKIYKSGFFWGDCAPRNMILNLDLSEIRILDFERNLIIDPVLGNNEKFLIRHFRNYSYEEFFSFLFKSEHSILKRFILGEPLDHVLSSNIGSKRKKSFLIEYFGEKEYYSTTEIAFVEDLIVKANTPFEINNIKVFPIIIADLIYERIGFQAYHKFIYDFNRFSEETKYEAIESIRRTIR